MDDARQDPIAAIEQAVVTLRHARGHRGGPQWMREGHANPGRGHPGRPATDGHGHDGPAHLEHMPILRGRRGAGDRSLGGAARFRLLGALRAADGMSVSEIADAIGVDQPRASRLVNDAAEHGLVDRRADERDARRSVVRLTDAGRAQLEQTVQSRRTAVTQALTGFTPDETERFAELLTRFVESWRRDV